MGAHADTAALSLPVNTRIADCIAIAITTPLQVLSYFIDIIVDLQSLKGMQLSNISTIKVECRIMK